MDKSLIIAISFLCIILGSLYFVFTGTEIRYDPNAPEPKIINLQCIPTPQERIDACMSIFHCTPGYGCEKNEYEGYIIEEICSDPNETIILQTNGCIEIPKLSTKVCGDEAFSCSES